MLPNETLLRDVPLCEGDNPNTTFRGHHPFKIWEGKHCSKLGSISDNFRLWPRMSLKQCELSKWNSKWSTTANPLLKEKNCDIRSTRKKVLLSHSDLPKVSTALDFRQFYILTGSISATDWDIKNWYSKWSTTPPLLLGKKLVNFRPLRRKFCCLISTYLKSTVHVLCMLMHLTSCLLYTSPSPRD